MAFMTYILISSTLYHTCLSIQYKLHLYGCLIFPISPCSPLFYSTLLMTVLLLHHGNPYFILHSPRFSTTTKSSCDTLHNIFQISLLEPAESNIAYSCIFITPFIIITALVSFPCTLSVHIIT